MPFLLHFKYYGLVYEMQANYFLKGTQYLNYLNANDQSKQHELIFRYTICLFQFRIFGTRSGGWESQWTKVWKLHSEGVLEVWNILYETWSHKERWQRLLRSKITILMVDVL